MSHFTNGDELERSAFGWGDIRWRLGPQHGADMVVIDVTIDPGEGHDFHRHPSQQEIILVRQGRIVQYLETEARTLEPGGSVFVDRGVVHASFNDTDEPVELLIVLTPALADGHGYAAEDVSEHEPWSSLR